MTIVVIIMIIMVIAIVIMMIMQDKALLTTMVFRKVVSINN